MPRLRRSSSFCTCTHGDAVGYPVVAPPALGLVVISVLTVRPEGLLHRLVLNSLLMVKIFVKEYGPCKSNFSKTRFKDSRAWQMPWFRYF